MKTLTDIERVLHCFRFFIESFIGFNQNPTDEGFQVSCGRGKYKAVNMLQTNINLIKKGSNTSCRTIEFNTFCIRNHWEYVGAIRGRESEKCWPFGSICDFKDFNAQTVTPASQLPKLFERELAKENDTNSKSGTAADIGTGKADKADKIFTIDDEDVSDGDTLGSLLRKRKEVTTPGSCGSWNKKACVAKPPRGSNAKTKTRKSPAEPHDNFATGKLAKAINAVEDEMALAAKRRKSGSYDMRGGTMVPIVCRLVAGVGGTKDPGMVAATPCDHWTLVCSLNRNPTDFSISGHENKYMIRYRV